MAMSTLTEAPAGGRAITNDLMARLERHYIKPGQPLPGGTFLPEVGWNGGGTSRCDALYVGFTGSSGRILIGHEVKASRADWLTELGKPGKADAWADQCHAWWLVTVPGVVSDGELPDGWGLMYPGKSATRMQVVTPARVHRDRVPSWDAVRSVIARQDTLRAQAIAAATQKAREAATAEVAERVERDLERALQRRSLDDAGPWRDRVQAYERIFGVQLVDDAAAADDTWRGPNYVTEREVTDVVHLLKTYGSLRHATQAFLERYRPTQAIRRNLDDLDRVIERARIELIRLEQGATP